MPIRWKEFCGIRNTDCSREPDSGHFDGSFIPGKRSTSQLYGGEFGACSQSLAVISAVCVVSVVVRFYSVGVLLTNDNRFGTGRSMGVAGSISAYGSKVCP